jgi:hypothetical protein
MPGMDNNLSTVGLTKVRHCVSDVCSHGHATLLKQTILVTIILRNNTNVDIFACIQLVRDVDAQRCKFLRKFICIP